MERRKFFKMVGLTAVSAGLLSKEAFASNGDMVKKYKKAKIVDESGAAITTSNLAKDQAYIFAYPLIGTPSFLVNLPSSTDKCSVPTSEGSEYSWDEGVGPGKSIVAFSSICAHGLAHPAKGKKSSIAYYGNEASADKKQTIHCQAHLSTYDLRAGGKNVAGSSIRPQAAVVLETDGAGNIYAVAMKGETLFGDYFKLKDVKRRLKKELGKWRKGKKAIKKKSVAVLASKY